MEEEESKMAMEAKGVLNPSTGSTHPSHAVHLAPIHLAVVSADIILDELRHLFWEGFPLDKKDRFPAHHYFQESSLLADVVLRHPISASFKLSNVDANEGMLWEKRWALRRLLAIMMASFGIGMMYYGMPLNLENLNANLHITVALNAAIELLSALVIFFFVDVMSRRRFMVGLMVVSGGCSLACTAMGGWLAVVLELFAFFGVFTSFMILMIYTVELFPTCVRTSALAVVRQAVVLGGVAAPAIVAVGRRRRFLSFDVFGIVIIFCALFFAFLPEIRGRGISDTMEEEESKMVMKAKGVINPSSS
ncbi:organic cation/carnitine transporter 3-like [Phalaenopsis equestris]|uniref:organic cation/carnitine transporter 3-like n=1 Tax=Phalaenopsis equestris TaxID=78828 RepID=UPI0009E4905C|nr:organic cation/carnitine transporter 3-like [Phalaenopsis equestris]